MSEIKTLAPINQALTPAEVVDNAAAQAKQLMSIVKQTKCYQEIRGKQYLQVEAWETIGAFNRVHAETTAILPIKHPDDSSIIGYQARVQLIKDGLVVGGAIMPCYFTENACKGKHGDDKHKACMSAAQTFATSKSYRMNFSYVAILAGYQPTPAEEATEEGKEQEPKSKPPLAVDMDWLKGALIELDWQDIGQWIKSTYPEAQGKTIKELIQSLSWEHQEQFVNKVQRRLEDKGSCE